jgi:hypothetical protein
MVGYRKNFPLFLVIILSMFLIFSGCEKKEVKEEKAAAEAEFKVGTLLSHTGPLKEFGPNLKNGCVLAAIQMKEAGLNLELIHEDSETSAIPATNAAKKLVEVDKVVAIVGALASGVTVPVAESVTAPSGSSRFCPLTRRPICSSVPVHLMPSKGSFLESLQLTSLKPPQYSM